MSQEPFEGIAVRYEEVAKELELAIAHLKTTAAHFRSKELARAGAHAFAVTGHLKKAEQKMNALAILHADNAKPLEEKKTP